MTNRVQFRAEQSLLDYLAGKGLNPNELARDLLEAEVRRMRAEDRHALLLGMQVAMPVGGERMVREDREGRERWRPLGPS